MKGEKKVEKNKNKQLTVTDRANKSKIVTKLLLDGSSTLILVLLVIAIYVGINVVLEKVILPEIDLTVNSINSLSEESISKIQNIEEEVTIYVFNMAYNTELIRTIERYVEVNKNITFKNMPDTSERPDLAQNYGIALTESLITVQCGEKEDLISEYDLYTMDYNTYEYINKTEEVLTNAIINVTTAEKPTIYFLSNHILYSASDFMSMFYKLQTEANNVMELDLLVSGEVPDDCSVLMMTTLAEDITVVERDSILKYISEGGKILLLSGYIENPDEMPNYQAILDEYGVTIENGIVCEQSGSNMLTGTSSFVVEPVSSSSLTEGIGMSLKVCFPLATKLVFDEENLEELNVTYEELVRTTDSAFLRTDISLLGQYGKTDMDGEDESILLGASVTKQIDEETVSKLVVYTNEMFAMDVPIQVEGQEITTSLLYDNLDMVLNSFAYLNGRENSIIIRKDYNDAVYTLTGTEHTIVMVGIFAVPVLIIAIGVVVWQVRARRGNKKV